MRSEEEMYDLILGVAKKDERVRAVMLNGSRANPNATADIFQDFDIVYFVTDLPSYKRTPDWIDVFGEMMILQLPDDFVGTPQSEDGSYGYLMQFADGNRIDLTLVPIESVANLQLDSLSVLLLDKDGLLPPFPPPSEAGYLPEPPTAKTYDDCTNEFWWVAVYVAKGLWREELPLAKALMENVVRSELFKMLTWHIGVQTQFSINPGKYGAYYNRYLSPEMWDQLLATYADADYQRTWDALLVMGDLFRQAALTVGEHFGFEYPHGDDERVSAHLDHVRALPRDAQEMY